ncbi:N-carbamoyl-L-amino acid hydrolase [Raoultella terrigena]|uniref:N-carbamoyl-L-amino acid hydrolase n=1 Tax=Raoultella terrigena TaxID=577 RepID=A0A4U9D802_RAOTE|nr:N-carbamoyl-L-amino acid hydrolase [Raoultella terrigena]
MIGWAKAAGMSVSVDKIGNVFMRREGRNPQLPPIVSGSHIDTQPTGGKFDGNYGVLAALEVVRTLNDLEIETEAPIEVVFWTNEEGSRFVPVMMGSGVFAGVFALERSMPYRMRKGKRWAKSWRALAISAARRRGSGRSAPTLKAHIEQGPILEAEEKVIGVVQGVLGIRWYDCVVSGQESHAGPTPMRLRKDALQVATHIMQEVVAIAGRSEEGRGDRGPGAGLSEQPQRGAGRSDFSIDMRNLSDALVDEMDRQLREFIGKIEQESGLAVALKEVSHYPAAPFHAECQAAIAAAAQRLGYPAREIVSGAGHDAVYMSYLAPTGMIFIPCKDGISHNEIEYASPEHVTAGR